MKNGVRTMPLPLTVRGQLIDHQVGRPNAGALGDRCERLVGGRFVVDVAVFDGPEPVEAVEHEHLVQVATLGGRRGEHVAQGRIGQRRRSLRQWERSDGFVGGVEPERIEAALEAHEQSDDSAGHLGNDRDPFVVRFIEQRQHVFPEIGSVVRLVQIDADRASGSSSQLLHPRPLLDRKVRMVGCELENPVANLAERPPIPNTSSRPRWCRARLAVLGAVDRVREVEKPSAPARSPRGRSRPSPRCRRPSPPRSCGAALAHHVGAHRAVRDLRADVDRELAFVDRVEVLGEGLPVPR